MPADPLWTNLTSHFHFNNSPLARILGAIMFEASWGCVIYFHESCVTFHQYVIHLTLVHLGWGKQRNTAVVVIAVIPPKVTLSKLSCLLK